MEQRKMPRLIKTVQQEILQHPEYQTKLNSVTRFCFEGNLEYGHSGTARTENRWYREIWKYLYLDEDVNGEFSQQ